MPKGVEIMFLKYILKIGCIFLVADNFKVAFTFWATIKKVAATLKVPATDAEFFWTLRFYKKTLFFFELAANKKFST